MLEKQNHKWPWNNDAKETSILKEEKSLFLFGSHLTHSLPVVTERCQKTREIFTFNHRKSIIWQFSYNSSLLGLTQRKEKILRRGVNRKEVKKKKKKIYTMYWSDSRDLYPKQEMSQRLKPAAQTDHLIRLLYCFQQHCKTGDGWQYIGKWKITFYMAYKKPKLNRELKGFGESLQCNRVLRRWRTQCGKTSGAHKRKNQSK